MTAGRIESVTPDWRGDTLAADVAVGAVVLPVTDTADFDDDPTSSRWLTIADSTSLRYVDVDHDAATVTLADPLAVAYDAGLPVVVFDPTVAGGGAQTVEFVASVETDRGPVPAVVPHEMIPLAGVDNLVGASVTLVEDDDGEWYIDRILGRGPRMDPGYLEPDPEVPAPWEPDGNPPSYSPLPVLLSGIGSVIVHWQEVPNADAVSYEVYLAPGAAPVIGGGTYVGKVQGSMLWVRATADGTPLVPGTEYFVTLVATDADGSAPPSETASIVLQTNLDALLKINQTNVTEDMVESPLIQAKIMNTVILNASTITADEAWIEAINSVVVTANEFQTSNDPTTGIKIGAMHDGFKAFDGTNVSTSIDQYTGEITAYGATINGLFRTGSSGQRVEIRDFVSALHGTASVELYPNDGYTPALITAYESDAPELLLEAPNWTGNTTRGAPNIRLFTDWPPEEQGIFVDAYQFMFVTSGRTEFSGRVEMGGRLDVGGYATFLGAGGANILIRDTPDLLTQHGMIGSPSNGFALAFGGGDNGVRVVDYANQNTYKRIAAAEFHVPSDERIKANQRPVTGALDALRAIPVYDYDDPSRPAKRTRGALAQDIGAALPDLVTPPDTDEEPHTVGLYGLISTLMAAVRELDARTRPPGKA